MPNRSFPGNFSIRKPAPKIINYTYDSPDNVGYTCAPETCLQKGCEAHPPFTTSGLALEARPTRRSDWGQRARSTFQLRLTATQSYGNVSGHGDRWCLDIVSLPCDTCNVCESAEAAQAHARRGGTLVQRSIIHTRCVMSMVLTMCQLL